MLAMIRQVVLVCALLFVAACNGPPKTCLSGTGGCERAPLCEGLQYQCSSDSLFIGRLADLPGGLDLQDAEGTGIDFVLQNDAITVVIDALEEPHGLAPTGGNIIDMGGRNGSDDLNIVYQLAGILPEDAFAYSSAEVIDRRPEMVALVVRGTLDGREDVEVVTRYELRACDKGVRVRTELYNGSAEVRAMAILDTGHWGERNLLPFAPLPDQGFVQPGFELLTLQDSFDSYDYVLARAAEDDAPSYGFVSCDREQIQGVNSSGISSLGTQVELVRPGAERSYQRYLISAQSRDLAEVAASISVARQQLHGDLEPVRVSGRVVAEALPLAGSIRRSVLVLSEIVGDDLRRPLTTVVPDEQGAFSALVPSQSWLWYDLWSFGRIVKSGVIPRGAEADLGDLSIEMPSQLNVAITIDGEASYGTMVVHAAGEEERQRLTGSWLGEFPDCAPWLGPPIGSSPACNVVNVLPPGNDVELPAGSYQLWFSAGPERSLVRRSIEIAAGEILAVEVELTSLEVAPVGWLSTDLHVHGSASFDTSVPDSDRVVSFVARGIDVIASTDHDRVTDYASTIEALGVGGALRVIAGLETTPLIPFLDVPSSDFPKVIGHFNHWPVNLDPLAPRGGAPWDELMHPGELFEVLKPRMGPEPIHMLNHPWDNLQFGRDLGFLRAIAFDPRKTIPQEDDGSDNGLLVARGPGGTRNIDFQLIELQNGVGVLQVIKTRDLWFSLLSQGYLQTGVANSDSHTLDVAVGYGRSYVDAKMDLESFEVGAFNRALKAGHVMGGNGVFVQVSIGSNDVDRTEPGFAPYQPSDGDTLQIEVRAAPWIPVDEIRIVSSQGTVVIASGEQISTPEDALGKEGLIRYQASIPLATVLRPGVDDWLVVEAGVEFFLTADLDDDGVVDTTDNNGDGVINALDIEEGEDSGPLLRPADPTDATHPLYPMTRILPGAWPYGFANPLIIDWDNDGWQAPGVTP